MAPSTARTGRAYLDHAATTPMRPEAVEAMLPYLAGEFGNPSGGHHESRRARRAVDDAREQLAALLGADLGEVVFTSGGTEADNLAVVGGWEAASPPAHRRLRRLVCAAMEHHAVLDDLPGPGPADRGRTARGAGRTRTGSSTSTPWPRRARPRWGWCR